MALCQCIEGPRCEYHYCSARADYSVWQPRWGKNAQDRRARGFLKFMCEPCWKTYHHAMTTPMKGIDRPEGVAAEDWRGSLVDHIRHAEIAMAFEDRHETSISVVIDRKRFTPEQARQLNTWREAVRRHNRSDRTTTTPASTISGEPK